MTKPEPVCRCGWADLGLDAAPVPGFTEAEMQMITSAAKIAAIKCLRARARRK